MQIQLIQQFLADNQIDAWFIYDFRGNNPVLSQLLPGKRWTTRRVGLIVPARGKPLLAVHRIDAPQFQIPQCDVAVYLTWQQWRDWLVTHLGGGKTVAMEYSPGGDLPAVSIADAGIVDHVRSLGARVVSSADLMQLCVARWSPEAREAHDRASRLVDAIKDEAFDLVRARLRDGQRVDERQVQQHILSRFAAEGLDPADPPIVAVNAHSADPHFEVSPTNPAQISRGDWVLIDLWARWPGEEHIFSDITWVAFAGDRVPEAQQRAFEAVRSARDAALTLAQDAWKTRTPVAGFQLDRAAQDVFRSAGYEQFLIHRTGHSLSPGPKIHGLGVNIDDFETHDTRRLLPGLGFTLEPAVYLPDQFGCRLEINVYVDEQTGPVVTSGVQREIVLV